MHTRMKELRARRGLTQQQLADAVGVRRETIVHIEKGTYNPTLRLAHAIACALGEPMDDIFIFDDEKGMNGTG